MKHCLVCKITNLQDHISEQGKEFQTFEAGGYKLVTGKHYKEGQLGIVIPPGTVLPDNILEDMWLKGRLAGKKRNRVVAKQMFGMQSEAIFYGQEYEHNGVPIKSRAWNPAWKDGDEVSKEIGASFKDV
jgi:hypothetical protein